MVTHFWYKEHVVSAIRPKEKMNYPAILTAVSQNKALLGVMLSSFIGIVGTGMMNALNTYFFKDFFGDVKVMIFSGMLSVV